MTSCTLTWQVELFLFKIYFEILKQNKDGTQNILAKKKKKFFEWITKSKSGKQNFLC